MPPNQDGMLLGWNFKVYDLNAQLLDIPKILLEIQKMVNEKNLQSFKIDYALPFFIVVWWHENPITDGGFSGK